MGRIKKKLIEIVGWGVLASAASIGILNVLASEPYIMLSPPEKYIPNFTLKKYVEDRESFAGKTIAVLSYPGAKYGRYRHNKMVENR